MVEPGSPKGFRYVHSFREWIIKTKSRDEANIVAPCPHHEECPMARATNTWCHFSQLTQRYPSSVFPRHFKEKDIMNEKFSYLTVMKAKSPTQIYSSEFMANTPAEKSFFWPRMIRPVIKKHRHSIIDLCNSKGKIERRIIAKSHGIEAGTRKVKRMKWGDLWYFEQRIPNRFRKEGRFGKRLW